MALSSINIVLGGDIKPLEKALDDAVAKTEKAGKELSQGAADAVKKMSEQFQKIAQRDPSMATVRQLQNIAMTARALGPEFSDLANEVVKAAGKMKDDIGDMRAEVGYFASDTRRLDSVLGTMQGVAGAFGVAEGAMAVLGVQSEDFQKTMMKLQGIMAVVTGLQAVQNTLQQESAAIQGILALRTAALTAVQTAYTTATGGAVGAQRLMNLTMAAAPWAAALSLVAAVGYAMVQYSKNAGKVSATQKVLNEITQETNKNFATEAKNVGALVAIVNDQALSMQQRKNALAEIQKIYPDYLANQSLEKLTTDQLKTATTGLTAEILKQAKAKAAFAKLQELSAKMLEYEIGQQRAQATTQAEVARLYASGATASQVQKFIESQQNVGTVAAKQAAQIQTQIDAILKLAKAEDLTIAPVQASADAIKTQTSALKDLQKVTQNNLADVSKVVPGSQFGAGAPTIEKFAAATGPLKQYTQVVQQETSQQEVTMSDYEQRMTSAMEGVNQAFNNLSAQGLEAFGQLLGDIMTGQVDSFQDFGKRLLQAVAAFMKSFGQALIATATASKAFKELLIAHPVAAIAAGVALVAGSAVINNMLETGPNVTAFADGGIVSGPTLGLMGEYPGASTNPEVIAPLDKLKSLMKPSDSGSGFIASTHVSGRDLAIVLNRYNKDNQRG
jgi:broad specificity phosphatase PhoE